MAKGYDDGTQVHFPGMVTRAGGRYNDGMLMDPTGTPGLFCASVSSTTGQNAQGRSSKTLTANSEIAGVVVGDSRVYVRDYKQYEAIPVLADGYICVVTITAATAGDPVGYDANGKVGVADWDGTTGTYFPVSDFTKFETDAAANSEVVIRLVV